MTEEPPRFGRRADESEVEAARYGAPNGPAGEDPGPPAGGEPADDAGANAEPADESTAESPKADGPPENWWEDPAMPWKGKPGKQDLWCWVAIAASGVFAIAMLILRPILLGYNPYLLVALTGSRSGTVLIGALGAAGDSMWWLGLLMGTVSVVKFPLVYFWAGRLWGQGILDILIRDSPRAKRNAARAERLARKYGVLAVALSYLPIPIPVTIVSVVVGMAEMRWRTFILTSLLASLFVQSGWIALGWFIGDPAVQVADLIARYSLYLSLGILVVLIIGAQIRKRRAPKE